VTDAKGVTFAVLGPLEVRRGVELVRLSGKHRALLGMLLVNANSTVARDHLVVALWNDAPRSAVSNLQLYVSGLRRALGDCPTDHPAVLETRASGYHLHVDCDQLDLLTFVDQARRGRQRIELGDLPGARLELERAVALRRGRLLEDVSLSDAAGPQLTAIEEQLDHAWTAWVEVRLALGDYGRLVGELRTAAEAQPLREGIWEQLILALHLAGRRSEALDTYRRARGILVEDLGIEPGLDLQRLHAAVLADDPALNRSPSARRSLATVRLNVSDSSVELDVGSPPRVPVVSEAWPVPAQLPQDPAGFVGRTTHLRQLDALLTNGPAATTAMIGVITGTAGVGKTTLAVHWAHRVRNRFPDGQLYLNLHGFDAVGRTSQAEAVRTLLEMLRVPTDQIPTTLEAQSGLYRSILAGRQMLIVLDNAHDADQVRPLLPGVSSSMVLITSRDEFTSLVAIEGAHPLPLDLLSAQDARELLICRLGAARVAAEPDMVDDIIAGCARLPLALAIAAARAATHPELSLGTLAGEPREPGSGLDAFDGGDQVTRVRTVFSWSYRTLTPEAARLFRLLGLHPGPDIAAPAAASLAGCPPGQVRQLLTELSRAHMVTGNPHGRYTFHDLLRAYATELAHAPECDTENRVVIHRLLDHYLHTARTAYRLVNPHRGHIAVRPPQPGVTSETLTDNAHATAWLDAERAVLIAMIAHAANTGFDAYAWQLTRALTEFLDRRGYWHDLLLIGRTALAAACRQADAFGQAHAHRGLAIAHARLSQHDDAYAHFSQALHLFAELGDHAGRGRTHLGIAWLLARQHHHPQALHHAQQALDLHRTTGNQAGQADALNAVGWHHAHLGDHEQALTHCLQALTLHQQHGDRRGSASTWDSLGYVYHNLGHDRQATTCYQHAVNEYRKIGDRYNEAETLTHLGDTQHITGSHRTARRTWHQAFVILSELNHPDADRLHTKLTTTDTAVRGSGGDPARSQRVPTID
jgi:DNA-binding SARP family transcriptional activator